MSDPKWITTARSARILGITRVCVSRIAAAGGVRVKQLPGLSPRYLLEDIERVAREAVGSDRVREVADAK